MKITIFTGGFFLCAREIREERLFTDENNFFLLNIKMIVFGLLARKKDGDKSRLVVERAKFAN